MRGLGKKYAGRGLYDCPCPEGWVSENILNAFYWKHLFFQTAYHWYLTAPHCAVLHYTDLPVPHITTMYYTATFCTILHYNSFTTMGHSAVHHSELHCWCNTDVMPMNSDVMPMNWRLPGAPQSSGWNTLFLLTIFSQLFPTAFQPIFILQGHSRKNPNAKKALLQCRMG